MRISKPRRHESGSLEGEVRWAPQQLKASAIARKASSGAGFDVLQNGLSTQLQCSDEVLLNDLQALDERSCFQCATKQHAMSKTHGKNNEMFCSAESKISSCRSNIPRSSRPTQRRRPLKSATSPALGLLLSAGLAASAQAQTTAPPPSDSSATIEVNAKRMAFRGDTPLKDLPQAATTVSDELISALGATQLDSLLDLASGVARQNTFGGLWDSFAIRGFAGDENTPSGYLVNGFNAGRGFSGRRDASNIELVEVLKGPGSALFGRAEPGGTINLITKKPRFKPEGSIELSLGSFDTYRLAADYTGPISNTLAFRINGAYEDAGSFRDYFTSRKLALTPSFVLKLGAATTLTYEAEVVRQAAPFDRGIVATAEGQLGAVPPSRFLGEPGDGDTKVEALGHQLVLNHDLNKDWSLLAGLGYRDSSFKGFSSDAELVAGRQTFYQTTAATHNLLLSRQRRYRDYSAKDLSVRAELSGRVQAGAVLHHVMIGIDAFDYKLDQVQTRVRPTLANPYGIDVFNPVYGQTRTPAPFTSTYEKQQAAGVYLQDQMDLTQKLKLLLGVRFDRFEQDLQNRISNTAQNQDKSATSPRIGVVYQFTPTASVYSSCSKGFRPNSGQNAAGVAFEPETSESCEVGSKLQSADKSIGGTVALYRAKKSNILTSDPLNAGFSTQAGKAQSQGLEIDVAGRIADDWLINASYAYTDAKLTSSVLDANFGFSLPAGSRLINIPKQTANLLLIREFQLAGQGQWSLGGGLTYVGQRLGETGVPSFQLPAYTLLSASATYAPNTKLKFLFNVQNLTDRVYYPSSYARVWVAPGSPRAITLRMQYQFQ
jgi:iron complex outermembrane recepter protein